MTASFEQLLYERLIPEFCSDPKRGCHPSGFRAESAKIADADARDFIKALEFGLIRHEGHGRYRGARSAASEQFLWEGIRRLNPRPFTLSIEPVITVAGLARLHFEHHWPVDLLGTQSIDWAFDLVAFLPDKQSEFIAGEVKKSAKGVHDLVALMQDFGRFPMAQAPSSAKARNAYKKVLGLRARRAPVFWALGPERSAQIFHVKYSKDDFVEFVPAGNETLDYPRLSVE